MPFKVIIEPCYDRKEALQIALAIASYAECEATRIYEAILTMPVCVKNRANSIEAQNLKERFENIGASVRIESATNKGTPLYNSIEEEEEPPGRIRTPLEYTEQLKSRGDIFYIEKERRLLSIEVVCLCIAICIGSWLSTQQVIRIINDPDYIDPHAIKSIRVEQPPVKVVDLRDYRREVYKTPKRSISKTGKSDGTTKKTTGGGGSNLARVTGRGVLGFLSAKISGLTVVSSGEAGLSGYNDKIDALLMGQGGLRSSTNEGAGRRGLAYIGNGAGLVSGTGGEPGGGIDDYLDGLFCTGTSEMTLKKGSVGEGYFSGKLKYNVAPMNGGRDKRSVMRVVMQNLNVLRFAYNRRLREKPGLKGRITCKFVIDEFGSVAFCDIISSTINDTYLEQLIVKKIRRWKFEKVHIPGDMTEVVYPFVFTS